MRRNLVALTLYAAAVLWAASGWPVEPAGSVWGCAGLIGLIVAGTLTADDDMLRRWSG